MSTDRDRSFGMQLMFNPKIQKQTFQFCAKWVLFAVVASFLGGCMTSQTAVKPTPDITPKGEETQKPGPGELAEGLDGFIINEVAQMDRSARNEFERAVVLLNDAQYAEAIERLEKVIQQSPGVTAPYINLGMAYQRTDKPKKAEAQFKAALKLMPDHPVAGNQYGLLCRKAGRFDEARTFYEQALSAYPNYYPAHRNLGILCDIYLDDLESALGHYEIYSQAMPEDKQVVLWIADLRARLGIK